MEAGLFVSFQIALVTGGVVAAATHVVLLAAVHGQMSLEQRLAAEVTAAVSTLVAGAVEDEDVITQRRFALEDDRAALQLLVGLVVHRRHVPLEVVLPVRQVAALRTAEQPLAAAVDRRRCRQPGGLRGRRETRRCGGENFELPLGRECRRRSCRR